MRTYFVKRQVPDSKLSISLSWHSGLGLFIIEVNWSKRDLYIDESNKKKIVEKNETFLEIFGRADRENQRSSEKSEVEHGTALYAVPTEAATSC